MEGGRVRRRGMRKKGERDEEYKRVFGGEKERSGEAHRHRD